MRFHVITPFSRQQNFEPLLAMLKREGAASWTLLIREGEKLCLREPLPSEALQWLKIMSFPVNGQDIGLVLVHSYIQSAVFVADDRYLFLCDDDWLEPGFFEKLDSYTDPLLIVGMLRGDNTPAPGGHPTWPLIPGPDSLRYGFTGFEQGVFAGRVLSRLAPQAEEMKRNNVPNEALLFQAAVKCKTTYVPGVNVWFNYLEPGRWNK